MALVAAASAVITAAVGIVAVNVLPGERKLDRPISSLFAVSDPEFPRAMSALFGPALVPGNRVTPLYNSRQIFEAMLADIRRAEKTITFETYIY